jgi:hypothetical protein
MVYTIPLIAFLYTGTSTYLFIFSRGIHLEAMASVNQDLRVIIIIFSDRRVYVGMI